MTRTIETNCDWEDHWSSVGHRVSRDDLFRQVGRTIGGIPMAPHQIESTVKSIILNLHVGSDDVLLDLCCGNGMITACLANFCRFVIGIDYSLQLIQVAEERHSLENTAYIHRAAEDLRPDDFRGAKLTKVCMIVGLQYFTEAKLKRLLRSLQAVSDDKLLLYFAAIPDAAKIRAFYNTPERWAEFEKRREAGTEAIGTWWDRSHVASIFNEAGYTVQSVDSDSELAFAHYRFSVLAQLEP